MSHRKHRDQPSLPGSGGALVPHQATERTGSENKAASPTGPSAEMPSVPAAMNLDTLLAFTWKVHDYTSELIRFADTKASIVLALSCGILSILFGAKIHNPFVKTWFEPAGPDWREILLGVGALMALALLGSAIAIAVTTIVPRLSKSKSTSFTFWHGILQHGDQKTYASRLLPLAQDHILQSLAEEVFVLAGICERKYQHVQWSIWLAAAGAAVGCAVFFFSS